MTTSLAEAEVEVVKLARLLGTEPGELGFLRQIDWRALRDLREQMTVVMFEADRQMLQRVAAATRLVPPKITATIGERAFGPLLCARVAGLLDPSRAVDIAGHLPARFLADVAGRLDPRRASRVIAEIPPGQIAQVTRELARRGDHVTMGGFVGHLPERALRAALAVVDDATLLRTAFVVESKGSLDALVAIIPESRLAEVMRTATGDDLWREALDVLRHVSERQRGRLGDIAAGQDDDVLEALVRTAQRDGLWGDVLPVTRAMSPAARARFARLGAVQRRPVLAAIMDAAHRERLWPPLVGFAIELELRTQREVARLAAALDDDVLAGLLAAVREAGLQDELVTLAGRLGAKQLRVLSARAAELGEDALSEQLGLGRQLPG